MPETRSLVKKLCKVMAEIGHIPKRGRNDFHRYDYVMEADLADAVRDKLAALNVMLLSSVDDLTTVERTTAKGGVTTITTVKMTFTFLDGDTGEALSFCYYGQGEDPMDKGAYKAFTGAMKYALMKSFLVPTGDDPEAEERGKPTSSKQPADERPAQPRTTQGATQSQETPADKVRAALLKAVNTVATNKGLADRAEVHRLASIVCERDITSLNQCSTDELKRFLAFLNGKEAA